MKARLCEEFRGPPIDLVEAQGALRRIGIAQVLAGDFAARQLVVAENERMLRPARVGAPKLRFHAAPAALAPAAERRAWEELLTEVGLPGPTPGGDPKRRCGQENI